MGTSDKQKSYISGWLFTVLAILMLALAAWLYALSGADAL